MSALQLKIYAEFEFTIKTGSGPAVLP